MIHFDLAGLHISYHFDSSDTVDAADLLLIHLVFFDLTPEKDLAFVGKHIHFDPFDDQLDLTIDLLEVVFFLIDLRHFHMADKAKAF